MAADLGTLRSKVSDEESIPTQKLAGNEAPPPSLLASLLVQLPQNLKKINIEGFPACPLLLRPHFFFFDSENTPSAVL